MKSFILLENLVFYAFHGVLTQETTVGNEFQVSLKIEVDVEKAAISDEIADTINYADLYCIIEQEMRIPSKLIEHLAKRIIDKIKQKYTQIESIEIKLNKRHPPIKGQIESAGVILIDK